MSGHFSLRSTQDYGVFLVRARCLSPVIILWGSWLSYPEGGGQGREAGHLERGEVLGGKESLGFQRKVQSHGDGPTWNDGGEIPLTRAKQVTVCFCIFRGDRGRGRGGRFGSRGGPGGGWVTGFSVSALVRFHFPHPSRSLFGVDSCYYPLLWDPGVV